MWLVAMMNATTGTLGGEPPANDDVRLNVNHVGRDISQHLTRIVTGSPRQHESYPVVRQPAQRGKAVHGHRLTLDDLGAGRGLAPALTRRDDVHLVAALHEPGSKSLGETSRPVDVWGESIAGDHHAQSVGSIGSAQSICLSLWCHRRSRQNKSMRDG